MKTNNIFFNLFSYLLIFFIIDLTYSKIVLLSYATDDDFNMSKIRFELEAKSFYDFDKIKIYRPEDLSKSFTTQYKNIFQLKRGAGYWIWRIHIIENELKLLQNDDILLFVDIGCSFKKKYLPKFIELVNLLKASSKSILGFELPFPERVYTKAEIFDYFNISKIDPIRNSSQLQAGILFLKKSEQTRQYVNLYLKALSDVPDLITDHLWKKQDPIFRENRHDQSLHSIICKLLNVSILIPNFTHNQTPIIATRLRDKKILEILAKEFD